MDNMHNHVNSSKQVIIIHWRKVQCQMKIFGIFAKLNYKTCQSIASYIIWGLSVLQNAHNVLIQSLSVRVFNIHFQNGSGFQSADIQM